VDDWELQWEEPRPNTRRSDFETSSRKWPRRIYIKPLNDLNHQNPIPEDDQAGRHACLPVFVLVTNCRAGGTCSLNESSHCVMGSLLGLG